MKTKLLVQILIVAFIGTLTVQAQEKIERITKKEIRQIKRDMRKAKKDIKNSMKDIHLDAIHFDGDWEGDDVIIIRDGKADHLKDFYFDKDFDIDFDFEFPEIPELEALVDIDELIQIPELEGYFELREIDELIEIPEIEGYLELAEIKELIEIPEIEGYLELAELSESGSTLALSKDLVDVSITKDFYFDVKEGANSLNMMIEGNLSSGDLTITVNKPNGEQYQKFQVSPLADVDWSQDIDLDEDAESYVGKWTIKLSGAGATGNYNLKFTAK